MKEIKREKYLTKLISKKGNGLIKIITGLRRSGKSYLLMNLFYKSLLNDGIEEKNIIRFSFDNISDIEKLDKISSKEETLISKLGKKGVYISSKKFNKYIQELTNDSDHFYILLDEIQLLENFEFVLNGLLYKLNFDIYVTGSNSKFLSSDIITEFRGRGDQIHLLPLTFKEYYDFIQQPFEKAFSEYSIFGGLPYICNFKDNESKSNYLKNLYKETYFVDLLQRHKIKDTDSFSTLIDQISSSIGSFTNPTNIENTFKTKNNITYSHITINNHLNYLEDAFLINKVKRYDIKGRKYIGSNYKYFFTDIGLRNARLNFRQLEPSHILENIVYNELISRGYDVDVGVVEIIKKNKFNISTRIQLQTDFVCNKIDKRIYIQCAYSLPDNSKYNQESNSLKNIKDSFKKVIIVQDSSFTHNTDDGILILSLQDFLLGYEL